MVDARVQPHLVQQEHTQLPGGGIQRQHVGGYIGRRNEGDPPQQAGPRDEHVLVGRKKAHDDVCPGHLRQELGLLQRIDRQRLPPGAVAQELAGTIDIQGREPDVNVGLGQQVVEQRFDHESCAQHQDVFHASAWVNASSR